MSNIVERLCETAGQLINGTMSDGDVEVGMLVEASDEIERLQKVRLIAEDVVWFDWTGNDADAVHAMEQLRLAVAALSPADRKAEA